MSGRKWIIKCNVGKTDTVIRFVIGILIIIAGLYFKGWWGVIGLILLLSALLHWCPAYILLGYSTCKPDGK